MMMYIYIYIYICIYTYTHAHTSVYIYVVCVHMYIYLSLFRAVVLDLLVGVFLFHILGGRGGAIHFISLFFWYLDANKNKIKEHRNRAGGEPPQRRGEIILTIMVRILF